MAFRVARISGTLLAVITAVLLATALPAAAHNELRSSNPPSGATLDTAPAAVMLTFAEELIPGQTTVTVTGPSGSDAAAGPAQLSGPTVTVPVKPVAAGVYTVGYKVIAADGDPTESTFTFTLSAAAVPAPTTTTTTTSSTTSTPSPATSQVAPAVASDSSDTVWWPYVVVALGLILIAVLVVTVRRGRAGRPETPSQEEGR
jgi:copper resistance protein C